MPPDPLPHFSTYTIREMVTTEKRKTYRYIYMCVYIYICSGRVCIWTIGECLCTALYPQSRNWQKQPQPYTDRSMNVSGDWGMISLGLRTPSHGGQWSWKGEPKIVVEDEGLKNQIQKQVLFLPVVLIPLYFSHYCVWVMLVLVKFSIGFTGHRWSAGLKWKSKEINVTGEHGAWMTELRNPFLDAALDDFGLPSKTHISTIIYFYRMILYMHVFLVGYLFSRVFCFSPFFLPFFSSPLCLS